VIDNGATVVLVVPVACCGPLIGKGGTVIRYALFSFSFLMPNLAVCVRCTCDEASPGHKHVALFFVSMHIWCGIVTKCLQKCTIYGSNTTIFVTLLSMCTHLIYSSAIACFGLSHILGPQLLRNVIMIYILRDHNM
jgi:hypothetical protein